MILPASHLQQLSGSDSIEVGSLINQGFLGLFSLLWICFGSTFLIKKVNHPALSGVVMIEPCIDIEESLLYGITYLQYNLYMLLE